MYRRAQSTQKESLSRVGEEVEQRASRVRRETSWAVGREQGVSSVEAVAWSTAKRTFGKWMASLGVGLLCVMLLLWWSLRRLPLSKDIDSPRRRRDPMESDRVMTCMPTVTRPQDADYVTDAVQSWYNGTKDVREFGRLILFNMDEEPLLHKPIQKLQATMGDQDDWLWFRARESIMRRPRKLTHGDSKERVAWRSKEALDYAEVLERCAREAVNAEYLLVVQDDVLFSPDIAQLWGWLSEVLEVSKKTWCTASLFDFAPGHDLDVIQHSNMVARVWRTADHLEFVSFVRRRFDLSPIDWLADEFCRARNKNTLVWKPNPIRHRGKISSFAGNSREGLVN